jgi:hypothetical protein
MACMHTQTAAQHSARGWQIVTAWPWEQLHPGLAEASAGLDVDDRGVIQRLSCASVRQPAGACLDLMVCPGPQQSPLACLLPTGTSSEGCSPMPTPCSQKF